MKNKILSGVLALSLVSSLATPAFAATSISEAGKGTEIPVELIVNAAAFSVTVPSVLPITVDADGTVYTADNAKITNNSAGLVEVKDIDIDMAEGWLLSTYAADFAAKNVDAKELGLLFNNVDAVNGSLHETFAEFPANSEQALEYNAKLPPQSSSITKEQIASVIFTIGWKAVPNPNIPDEVVYYESLAGALGAAKDDSVTDSGLTQESAQVAVGDINGKTAIVLMEDVTLTETLNVESDVMINLNGHKLVSTASPAVSTASDNVVIEASTYGSGVTVNAADGAEATAINVASGGLTVNGGDYAVNTSGAGSKSAQNSAVVVATGATLNLNDASVTSTDDGNGNLIGVNVAEGAVFNATGSDITVSTGTSLNNYAIQNYGVSTLTDCSVIGSSNYTGAGNAYTANANGIRSFNDLTLNNCYVWGAHAGVCQQDGDLTINGGTYNGYGHGGLYLANDSATNRIYNAELNWAPMLDGTVADNIAGTNGAALYIGGASSVTTYIDNCDFNMIDANGATHDDGTELPLYGIVLRKSGGESNNTVYISNSYVERANYRMFRDVGANNNTVYNGIGNDWSKAKAVHTSNSTYFIDTQDSYGQ